MEDMSSLSHCPDVKGTGVSMLTMSDGVDKLVGKFPRLAEEVGLHKVHHGVVCRGVGDRNRR